MTHHAPQLHRFEGVTLFIVAVALYLYFGYSWLGFLIGFVALDLSLLPYLVSQRIGALSYISVHNYAVPLIVLLIGIVVGQESYVAASLIWFAHVAFDRTTGFSGRVKTALLGLRGGGFRRGRRPAAPPAV